MYIYIYIHVYVCIYIYIYAAALDEVQGPKVVTVIISLQ